MQYKFILLSLFLIGLFTSSAFAVAPGGYLETQLGVTQTNLSPSSNYSTQNQMGGSILLGYQANDYFAGEFGYTQFASIRNSLVPTCGSSLIHTGALGLYGKGIYPVNIFGNTLGLFAKLGVAAVKTSGGGYCTSGGSRSTTAAKPLAGLGVSYDLTQNWVADITWMRVFLHKPVSSNYSNLLALGLSYHFVDKYCGQFLC